MTYYDITMRHTEKTFESLSHMQYGLFCKSNLVGRNILGTVIILLGILEQENWWAILLVAYGCYLFTSKYSSANHTAHKLAKQITESGMDFPASRFLFKDHGMEIRPLEEKEKAGNILLYGDVCRLGEDMRYFYLFRDQYGGYMVPKEQLADETSKFRGFLEEKTRLTFRSRSAPVLRLARRLSRSKS